VIYSASESEALLSLQLSLRRDRVFEESFDTIIRDLDGTLRERLQNLKGAVLDQEGINIDQINKL
jgi:hypothetical protein